MSSILKRLFNQSDGDAHSEPEPMEVEEAEEEEEESVMVELPAKTPRVLNAKKQQQPAATVTTSVGDNDDDDDEVNSHDSSESQRSRKKASAAALSRVSRPRRHKPLVTWKDRQSANGKAEAAPEDGKKKRKRVAMVTRYKQKSRYYQNPTKSGGVEGLVIEHAAVKNAAHAFLKEFREAEEGTPLAAIAHSCKTDGFREGFYEAVRVFFDAAMNEIVQIAAQNANRERGTNGRGVPSGGRHCNKADIEVAIQHILACRRN
jgi:hypothetical protein